MPTASCVGSWRACELGDDRPSATCILSTASPTAVDVSGNASRNIEDCLAAGARGAGAPKKIWSKAVEGVSGTTSNGGGDTASRRGVGAPF